MSGDIDHLVNQLELTCLSTVSTADFTAQAATASSALATLESQISSLDSQLRNIEGSDWWVAVATECLVLQKESTTDLIVRNTETVTSLADIESNVSRIRSRLGSLEDGMLLLPGC